MAKMIVCKQCKTEFWKTQKVCPNCGKRAPAGLKPLRILLGIILIVWGIISIINGTMPSSGGSGTASAKITLAEYNRIETGMTYAQVVSIVGGNGELQSENTIDIGVGDKIVTKLYSWQGDGTILGSAIVTIQNGEVTLKSQSGLK